MRSILIVIAVAINIVLSGCVSRNQTGNTTQSRELKIICLGDSITGQPNLKRYLKWSSLLECMIEARLGLGKVEVLNRGIGGDTTVGAVKRLQGDVLDQQPDIVIVLLGGNDACTSIDQTSTRKNLETIVRKCKGIGAKVLLLQYHVIPNPDNSKAAWLALANNNDLIAQVAIAEKVPLLDMGTSMTNAYNTQKTSEFAGRKDGIATWENRKMSQEHFVNKKDGVHLNPGGEIVFAREVFQKLLALKWIN